MRPLLDGSTDALKLVMVCGLALVGCRSVDPGRARALEALSTIEARRGPIDGALVERLRDPDPVVRARALEVLARVQEADGISPVIGSMDDPIAEVRSRAAWAAGVIGLSWTPLPPGSREALASALMTREDVERDPDVRREVHLALGRVRTDAARALLGARVAERDAASTLALGVATRAGAAPPPGVLAGAIALAAAPHPVSTRYAAVYLLAFSKDPGARVALRAALDDDDPDIRGLAARGLGEVGTDDDAQALASVLDDPAVRVAAEAVRSLVKLSARCTAPDCPFLGALARLQVNREGLGRGVGRSASQLLLTFAQGPLPPAARALLESARGALRPLLADASTSVRGDAARLDCRLAAALDALDGQLTAVPGCGGDAVPLPRRVALGLRAVASGKVQPAVALSLGQEHLASSDPSVRLAAVGVLAKAGADAVPLLRPLLEAPDLILAAGAASALAALGDRQSIPALVSLLDRNPRSVDVALVVLDALATLKATDEAARLRAFLLAPHAAIRHAAAAALTALEGTPVYPGSAPPVEGGEPPAEPTARALTLVTDKGRIVVRMAWAEAPRTSARLTALARRGYFDGLTFHRIVANFVVQGGDPRGDGEGGPGWTMPCEINRLPYRRGTVGMALSGKDTGGSQFFIALSPQPHLDGRYTVFGEVIEGIDVADRLLESDVIRRVEVD